MQRDLTPYVSAWRERFASAERSREDRAKAAATLLPALTRLLVEGYGATRVWVFGSLVEGGFHERSDIDLAAEGLASGAAPYRAAAELDDIASPFVVDLVPLEDAFPEIRAKVLTRGRLLHGDGKP